MTELYLNFVVLLTKLPVMIILRDQASTELAAIATIWAKLATRTELSTVDLIYIASNLAR